MDFTYNLEIIWIITFVTAYIVFFRVSSDIKLLNKKNEENKAEIEELKNRIYDLEN